MRLNLLFIYFFLFILSNSIAQERRNEILGQLSPADLTIDTYEADPSAPALVLYEQGINEFEIKDDQIILVKYVHRKIKIFDLKNFNGEIDIPLLTSGKRQEKVTKYKAITHNGSVKTYVDSDAIFVTTSPEIGKICRIVFPNLKNGSIIEYFYKIESPFFFNFSGWEFQGEYPKLYSEFVSRIPGNYNYRKVLYGDLKLDIQKTEVEENCLKTPDGYSNPDCVVSILAMFNVPAFKKEGYMLSETNYISRVDYEPKEFIDFYRKKQKFSTEWKDVDKEFRNGDYIGNQLNKSGFFKRNLPDSILSKTDSLTKAKDIYTFIQDHFTWDETYYSSETQVKDAFHEKKGSVPEINISLINALDAAGLDAKLVLLSTRKNGLPVEAYPVMTKFNYTLAVLKIGNKKYFLDATDKHAPFGVVPFRALNVQGRVMDFKNDSYWLPIEPFTKNAHYSIAQLTADSFGKFEGKVQTSSYGYIALEKRHEIAHKKIAGYIKSIANEDISTEIEDFKLENLDALEEPLKEDYRILLEPETVGDKVILYPFFTETYITENPFKLEDRTYPLDFGFPFKNTYLISIDLANFYEVETLPQSRTVKLPGDDGDFTVAYAAENDKINIRFNFNLNTYRYQPDAYQSLKELFANVVSALKTEPIVLRKI